MTAATGETAMAWDRIVPKELGMPSIGEFFYDEAGRPQNVAPQGVVDVMGLKGWKTVSSIAPTDARGLRILPDQLLGGNRQGKSVAMQHMADEMERQGFKVARLGREIAPTEAKVRVVFDTSPHPEHRMFTAKVWARVLLRDILAGMDQRGWPRPQQVRIMHLGYWLEMAWGHGVDAYRDGDNRRRPGVQLDLEDADFAEIRFGGIDDLDGGEVTIGVIAAENICNCLDRFRWCLPDSAVTAGGEDIAALRAQDTAVGNVPMTPAAAPERRPFPAILDGRAAAPIIEDTSTPSRKW
jgi:hypothetical protein